MIAFPKTASGGDPLTGAPAPVDADQLKELGIVSTAKPPAVTPTVIEVPRDEHEPPHVAGGGQSHHTVEGDGGPGGPAPDDSGAAQPPNPPDGRS